VGTLPSSVAAHQWGCSGVGNGASRRTLRKIENRLDFSCWLSSDSGKVARRAVLHDDLIVAQL